MKKLAALLVVLALLVPAIAHASCQGPTGVPFNCTPSQGPPSPADLVLGGNNTTQAGQTVQWTWGQVWTATQLTSPTLTNAFINSLNTPLVGLYGGTGIANSGKTITLGGNITTGSTLTTVGAFSSAAATALGVSTTTVGAGTYYAGHSLINIQTFCLSGCTTTSTGTYTATAGTNQVIIEVQAAGGGSGGCALTGATASCIGGSGAGGSYAKVRYTSGFSGITMTIGAAGAAGASGSNPGGTGGTTSAGALISCPGGGGGAAGGNNNIAAWNAVIGNVVGPAACTISGGTTLESVAGQASSYSFSLSNATGTQYVGASGSSKLGLGSTFAATGATTTGIAGTGHGWGAGGAVNSLSQAATAGLAGGPSKIIVYEFN